MKYVYHLIPKGLFGTKLYPLNQLKTESPATFEFQASKYKGRESLMDEMIPKLKCKWNDVVHLGPIHPTAVAKALQDAGCAFHTESRFYKIPISRLNRARTVIFKYTSEGADLIESEIEFFDPNTFNELPEVPQATLDWYKKCAQTKRPPLLFHRVPHILTLDPIDISDCEIVGWKIPVKE